jgi:membrane protein YqaA with SNARE-associated domain
VRPRAAFLSEGAALVTSLYMLALPAPYVALFATAFVAATLLPAQSEALLATMTVSGRYSLAALFAAATLGNVLGATLNWWLGRHCERFRERRWFPFKAETIAEGKRWYARWGSGHCCCPRRRSSVIC